ncbi:MAG: lipopolysaccharide heptosyltransferase II [Proteobacteria bacterium]|nr:lipopolysaccharide heptosyltransferase II [Pseudomonadota bacterium]MBU1738466.1 lipopolysaccharide heptosyltransferase II [Pseudomonadota bacterium]
MLTDDLKPDKILIRSTNWIGDAIMTTPAVRTIRENYPEAMISILAYPWVADIFRNCPHVDEVIIFDKKGVHQGLQGLWRLAGELRSRRFDLAILLQNAFEAAFITLLAGIPARAGYIRDGRRLLLNYPVAIRPEVRKLHQVHYYQWLCRDLGMTAGPDELFLQVSSEAAQWAADFVAGAGTRPVIGLNPGAAYGPAKCWPVERYGELAAVLTEKYNAVIPVFGTGADQTTAETIRSFAPEHVIDLAGKTSLGEAMALIASCDVFVTNDSGLMHVAAAQKTPLVAIFGSTDPVATGPFAEDVLIIRKEMECQPCFKTHCRTDFSCMKEIGVAEVSEGVARMLSAGKKR